MTSNSNVTPECKYCALGHYIFYLEITLNKEIIIFTIVVTVVTFDSVI